MGTTVKVYLPRATEPPIARAPFPSGTLNGTETIVLAEDQEDVRAIAQLALSRHGYTVLPARDGAEALRILETAAAVDLLDARHQSNRSPGL